MMSSVNTQIQRAINDAISGQIIPQIQSALSAGSGQSTLNKWNVLSERPEANSEETYSEKAKKSNRSEQRFDCQNGSQPNLRAYDTPTKKTGDVPQFDSHPKALLTIILKNLLQLPFLWAI